MENKYNLDFYLTMEVVNNQLDTLEDELTGILKEDKMIEETKQIFTDKILHLEDILNIHLERGEYQLTCNQLVINEMMNILVNNVLPERDMDSLIEYVESLAEIKLIEEVTRFIDKYNNV